MKTIYTTGEGQFVCYDKCTGKAGTGRKQQIISLIRLHAKALKCVFKSLNQWYSQLDVLFFLKLIIEVAKVWDVSPLSDLCWECFDFFFLYLLLQSRFQTKCQLNNVWALLQWRWMEKYQQVSSLNFNTRHSFTPEGGRILLCPAGCCVVITDVINTHDHGHRSICWLYTFTFETKSM